MMKINGFNGTNTQIGAMGMAQANDSVSKNIQNQIANAQQKLQDLSSNEELSLEDKMKKRQEIQQEITNLNQQLRQHQIEQRKEQQSKKSSMDDMVAGTKNTSAKKGTGLSQAGMRAMISADSSMKQAKVQGSMATQMEEEPVCLSLKSSRMLEKAIPKRKKKNWQICRQKRSLQQHHRCLHFQMQINRWKKQQRQTTVQMQQKQRRIKRRKQRIHRKMQIRQQMHQRMQMLKQKQQKQ